MIRRRPIPSAWALIVTLALLLGLTCAAKPLKADPHADAKAFVLSVVDEGVRKLTGKKIDETERRKLFLEFIYRYADSPNVEESLTGHYWDKATPEQRSAYKKLLEDYLVQSYAKSLSGYGPKEHVDVQGIEDRDGKVIVHTLDIDPDQPPPSHVDWILVHRTDGYRVGDVIFEGVGAVATLKADFTGAIRSGGGNFEALLSAMRAKISRYAAEGK
jgi:phospholipid transport system substrate-binding protein